MPSTKQAVGASTPHAGASTTRRRRKHASHPPPCRKAPGQTVRCVSTVALQILTVPELLNLSVPRRPHEQTGGTAGLAGVPRIGWDRRSRRASRRPSMRRKHRRSWAHAHHNARWAQAHHRPDGSIEGASTPRSTHVRKHTRAGLSHAEALGQLSRPHLGAVVSPADAAAGRSPTGTPLTLVLGSTVHTHKQKPSALGGRGTSRRASWHQTERPHH